ALLRPAALRQETERQAPGTQRIQGKSKSRPRRVLIWGSLSVVVAVILIFYARFSYTSWLFQPKTPASTPKPSETVSPRSMPSARPSASKPSVAASPTAPALRQPEPAPNPVMPVLARTRHAL